MVAQKLTKIINSECEGNNELFQKIAIISLRYHTGEYTKSLFNEINALAEDLQNVTVENQFISIYWKAYAYYIVGRMFTLFNLIDDANKYFGHSLGLFSLLDNHCGIAKNKVWMARGLVKNQSYDEALDLLSNVLQICNSGDCDLIKLMVYGYLGEIFTWAGNNEKALEYYLLREDLAYKTDNEYYICEAKVSTIRYYLHDGDLDQAITLLNEVLILARKLNHTLMINDILGGLSETYLSKGELDIAYEYGMECLNDPKNVELSLRKYSTLVFTILTDIMITRGQYDEALDLLETYLPKLKGMIRYDYIAQWYLNIGLIYLYKNETDRVMEYLKQSLQAHNETLSLEPYRIAMLYFYLIYVSIEIKDGDSALHYLDKFSIFVNGSENKRIVHRFHIAEALVLFSNEDLLSKARGVEIFKKFKIKDIMEFDLLLIVVINLVSSYIIELKISESPSLNGKIKRSMIEMSDYLIQMAERKKVVPILVETYLVVSKMKLISEDILESRNLVKEANKIAEANSLQYLVEKSKNQLLMINDTLSKWESLGYKAVSVKDKLIEVKIESHLDYIV
ncbi:MAG: tetratricopeptide repeat protein, partial [Candidatus Kariarchaeaceae archaeon]